jgi:hypothetical protein
MNQELRERFGKIAYQTAMKGDGRGRESWDELSDQAKELYCAVGEAVASDLAGMLVSPIQQMFQAFLSLMDRVNEDDTNT